MSILGRLRNLFAPPTPSESAEPVWQAPRPASAPEPKPTPDTPTSRRTLNLRGSDIARLDGPVTADISIDLSDCKNLETLPEGLSTGTLNLSGCTALEQLPAGLDVAFLDLAGCTALRELPAGLGLRGGRLNLKGCAQLTGLPEGLGEVAQLNLSNCLNIRSLPEGLIVTSWIDVGDSGVTELPPRFDHVGVRWNGVDIERRAPFAPGTFSH